VAIGAAACTSTSTPGSGASTTTSTPPASGNVGASRAQDQTTANSVVLQASDLPGSWKAGPIDPNSTAGDAQLARCLGIANSDPAETAYAGSPVFTQNTVQITSQTTVYTSASVVQEDLRGASSPQAATCVSQLLTTQLRVTGLQLSKTTLPATAGSLPGFRLTGSFQIKKTGGSETASFDEAALAHGRTEVAIDIVAVNTAEPVGLMDSATAAIAQRLKATA
jgi:hypothetical protein